MPTLLDGFSNRLAFILNDYVTTPTRLQEFLANPIKSMLAYLFFSKLVTSELELNQAKHTIAGNFSVLYLPGIGLRTIKKKAEALRKNPTLNALDLPPVSFTVAQGSEDLISILSDVRLLDTKETRSRNLDVFAHELTAKLQELQTIRASHKEGQLEGLFAANLAAVNVMINFYNKIAVNLIANFDAIDVNSDYYLRLMYFVATFMRDFAYDRELARYSEEHKIEISSEHFLGTGAEKLCPQERDLKLRVLYNCLTCTALVYSQMRLLKLIQQDPDVILSGNDARILALAFPVIKAGMNLTSLMGNRAPNLHIELYIYEQLMYKEINSISHKSTYNAEMLANLAKEYPSVLQPAVLDYDQAGVDEHNDGEVEEMEVSADKKERPLPVIELLNKHGARFKDYDVLSESGSEIIERPGSIMRARSAFTPQLTPQWGLEVTKNKERVLTPQCGPNFARSGHKRINVSPAPTHHKFTVVS